ncbi:hypothetical protein A7H1H_0145 [Aliarcobacter butzleri 7h1h]|uniref:DUF4236 domain-containing protein n=1 Tax=Aliarcobacter butzleri TaxID=28197 RepID=UPI0002D5C697|nr:DUF4236 domain-containing protein [Aliarcobacter butzleri]AGR76482.1 hypothetical protein A7H1H_0145 [Aliarcobacter butzleri 7h1h]
MAFRFRKSIKIIPGVRVNLSLKGASLNVGPRGSSFSIGKQGIYSNVSIPGMGISFRKKISNNAREERALKRQRLYEQQTIISVVLSLLDDGNIVYKDENENLLDRKIVTKLWQEKSDMLKNWLETEAQKINDMDLITSIHYDMPTPYNEPQLEELEFDKEMPIEPKIREVKKPSFFKSLFFPSSKQKYQFDLDNAKIDFQKQTEQYQVSLENWEKEKNEFIKTQDELKANFSNLIRTDINTMSEYLEKVLQDLDWARETLVSYDINNSANTVYIDIDLPEIENIPQRTATIAVTGKKLNIKNKTEKQLRLEYATHIHAIALRVAAYTFATLPSIDLIIISGYSQRLDKSTANTNDEYLYSIKFNKSDFSKLNFEKIELIDPIKAFDNFENIRNMTSTGIFKEIKPF